MECCKRMAISLFLGAIFGLFCAYGTMNTQVPGVVVGFWLLAGIVYNRMLIGFAIGLAGELKPLGEGILNTVFRGALIGTVVSLEMAVYGGLGLSSIIVVAFGLVYGVIIDLIATRLTQKTAQKTMKPAKRK